VQMLTPTLIQSDYRMDNSSESPAVSIAYSVVTCVGLHRGASRQGRLNGQSAQQRLESFGVARRQRGGTLRDSYVQMKTASGANSGQINTTNGLRGRVGIMTAS
jgi:hypothetical protein